ncbi:hypothetical protein Lal_00037790 [Lupinus albus]|nr:hypothetical protein Lal_00037790 [Lupinus albus]
MLATNSEASTSGQESTCSVCRKLDNLKGDCPVVQKQHIFKRKKDNRRERRNVRSEDDDVGLNTELVINENTHLSLVASYQSDEDYEVSNFEQNDKFSYDEL